MILNQIVFLYYSLVRLITFTYIFFMHRKCIVFFYETKYIEFYKTYYGFQNKQNKIYNFYILQGIYISIRWML